MILAHIDARIISGEHFASFASGDPDGAAFAAYPGYVRDSLREGEGKACNDLCVFFHIPLIASTHSRMSRGPR
jgi:hypothetical protein